MLIPSFDVCTDKGMHEYAMWLGRKNVSAALDRFYNEINRNKTNYHICGTRVERVLGNRVEDARFIIRYEVF